MKNGADSNNHSTPSCTDTLLTEANRCVSCGLCLPYCPTYRLTMSEADSPRGRIALMSGVASGNLPMNGRFVQHMDRCLTCRACEAVCPNNVAYGQLIDAARAMIATSSPDLRTGSATTKKNWLRRWLEREFITKPFRIDRMRTFFRFFQKIGFQQRLQKSHLLGKAKLSKLAAQVPPAIINPYISDNATKAVNGWQVVYPAMGKPCGEVGLFLGCVSRLVDVETLNSAIFVLNRLGYTVYVPSTQTCCGALHQHSGDAAKAAMLERQNKKVFGELNLSKIITTASGCGVQLSECHALKSQGRCQKNGITVKDSGEDFSSRIIDVSKFLVTARGWNDVEIRPLASKIAVHDPCSLRNGLRDQAYVYMLLAHIPKLDLVPLAGNDQCCGAAGTYFIDQPDFAMKLQAEKISAVNDSDIRYLVTSNIGCSLHIASGLRAAGSTVEVLHPVTLLARQMGIQ